MGEAVEVSCTGCVLISITSADLVCIDDELKLPCRNLNDDR